jgi:heme-degrading monooxygenase HmoA
VIARIWRGAVRDSDRDAYVRYMERTGIAEYAATPGNLAAYMLTRDIGDGRVEVVMVTLWESMAAVHEFAGPDADRAVFYPDDDRFLVDRDDTVTHYEVPLQRPAT